MFSLGNPDLVQFAQGLGAKACSVTTPAEMAAALAAAVQGALSGQPQVIVAQIDRSAEPPYYIKH
jgi:acetolactate synthase-1/2/3 large subunit